MLDEMDIETLLILILLVGVAIWAWRKWGCPVAATTDQDNKENFTKIDRGPEGVRLVERPKPANGEQSGKVYLQPAQGQQAKAAPAATKTGTTVNEKRNESLPLIRTTKGSHASIFSPDRLHASEDLGISKEAFEAAVNKYKARFETPKHKPVRHARFSMDAYNRVHDSTRQAATTASPIVKGLKGEDFLMQLHRDGRKPAVLSDSRTRVNSGTREAVLSQGRRTDPSFSVRGGVLSAGGH